MDIKAILGDAYNDDLAAKLTSEIDKEYVAKSNHESLQKQLAERDKRLGELSKVEPDKLQAEIARLQEENKTSDEKHAAELAALKLDSAIENRLLREGAVNTKAVRALLDSSKLGLDESGGVTGLDEQLKNLRGNEKWAFTAPSKEVPGSGGNPVAVETATKKNPLPSGTVTF